MQRYDKIYGDWVDIEVWAARRNGNFEEKARFYVQSDSLDKPLIHPATGRTHDSKSAFRRDTKASGCVEVGNDKPRIQTDPYKRMEPVQKDLYRAWDQLSR